MDANLPAAIRYLLDLVPQRQARLPEILAQAGGFEDYFLQMLGAGGGARPAVTTIVAAAVAIGQMVGMHWKWEFQRARPSQVYPALVPVLPMPAHAAYPSNHALQSMLCALALREIFPDKSPLRAAYESPLTLMADRIAHNREIAGVHFQSDSTTGKTIAAKILPLLTGLGSFQALLAEARTELGVQEAGSPPPAPPPAPAPAEGDPQP